MHVGVGAGLPVAIDARTAGIGVCVRHGTGRGRRSMPWLQEICTHRASRRQSIRAGDQQPATIVAGKADLGPQEPDGIAAGVVSVSVFRVRIGAEIGVGHEPVVPPGADAVQSQYRMRVRITKTGTGMRDVLRIDVPAQIHRTLFGLVKHQPRTHSSIRKLAAGGGRRG
jgi:hypothetical protein